MKTFSTPEDLSLVAKQNLNCKLEKYKTKEGYMKIPRKLLIVIFNEERKNPNHKLAATKLAMIFARTHSDEQKFKIYQMIANKLVQFEKRENDFLECVEKNCARDPIIVAMCELMRLMIMRPDDILRIPSGQNYLRYLAQYGLDLPFRNRAADWAVAA